MRLPYHLPLLVIAVLARRLQRILDCTLRPLPAIVEMGPGHPSQQP